MTASPRSFSSFWPLHLCGGAALGLSMWVGALAHVDDPLRAFVGKMMFAGMGGTLTLLLRPLYHRFHKREVSIALLVVASAVCSYVVSVGWTMLYKGSVDLLWEWVDGKPLTIPRFSYLISGALFHTFIPMAWSVLYFGVTYYQDVQTERERALVAEGQAHRARLQALRYQLNPHFLFNTLNAVSTLIVEEQTHDAERMVARLSDFLRLTLECNSDVEVPLADELDFARRYLDIEQIRFGNRLVVTEDVDPEALSARVPPLLLQPLVENAVRHGIMPREEGGTLRIEARQVSDRLLLRMTLDRPLSACIVDDEELARRGIRSRLSSHEDIRVAVECESGREAVEALRTNDLDLVFLDVQMPGLDGFDVIEAVGPTAMPVTIFVTAYDEYALRAFDVHALDYLLKPLDEERFGEALSHARERIAEQAAGQFGERLATLVSGLDEGRNSGETSPSATDRFVVKSSGRVRFVKADDIEWVEAAGDYVRLHTVETAHLLRRTMKETEQALDPSQFLRIHRSTIVDVDCLQELRPYGSNNEYVARLTDGTERKVSRTYRDAVDAFFDGAL